MAATPDLWLTPSILISLGSVLVACGGAFAVNRYQVNDNKAQMAELKAAMADLRRDMVSRAEYEAQIHALNNQLAQVVASITRMENRLDRVLDGQR